MLNKRILSELKAYKKEFDNMIGLPTNTLMPQMYQSMLNSLYDDKLSNIAKNVKVNYKEHLPKLQMILNLNQTKKCVTFKKIIEL